MTKHIPLTKGQIAIVDDGDFERLSGYSWSAKLDKGKYYAQRGIYIGSRTVMQMMHREILNAGMIDHINGDTLDNRKENLRPCLNVQNCHNRRVHRTNKLGIKGVHFRFGKFIPTIKYGGKQHHLGMYKTADEAAHVYNKEAIRVFDEFACINPVGIDPRLEQ